MKEFELRMPAVICLIFLFNLLVKTNFKHRALRLLEKFVKNFYSLHTNVLMGETYLFCILFCAQTK